MHKHIPTLLLAIALSACTSIGSRSAAPPAASATPAHRAHVPHLPAAPPPAPVLPSPVVVPLDAATLATLPRESVDVTAHDRTLHCEGVSLAALLRATGAMPVEPLRGAQLSRYVQVDARDGYRVLFALAELDPTLGGRKLFLVDRCDGKPLPPDNGPLRLLAPQESRAARWVRQVGAITVIVAP